MLNSKDSDFKSDNNDTMASLLKKFICFTIGPVSSAIIGFFIVPVTTWYISPDEFGKSSIFFVVLNLSTLLVYLGMDQAFIREYNSWDNKKQLLQNCFLLSFLSTIVLSTVVLIFRYQISYFIFEELQESIILLLITSLPIVIFNGYNSLIIRVQENGFLYSGTIICERVVNLFTLLILLVYYEKSFKSVIIAQFISSLFMSIVYFIINKKFWKFSFNIDYSLNRRLLSFGLPLIPTMMLSWLLSAMDKFSLKLWANYSEIGLYSVAFKLVSLLVIFQSAFGTFWSPTAYRWYEEKVSNERFNEVIRYVLAIVSIIFSIIVLSRNILISIFDSKYIGAANIVPFLLFVPLTEIIVHITGMGIAFSRKTGWNLVCVIIAVIFNLLGNYLLVPNFGGVGASISTGISYVIFYLTRTLISRKLWFDFILRKQIILIIMMICMSSSAILWNNFYVDIFFFSIIVFTVSPELKYLTSQIINTLLKNRV